MLSLVIPAYNEGEHIYNNIKIIHDEVSGFTDDFELIVVSDGCKDNTWDEVKRASQDLDKVVDAGYPVNKGKGGAIKTGVSVSKGEIVGFIDSDLDLPATLLPGFYKKAIENPNAVVIGSKMHKDSKLEYPFARKVFSFCYYIMLKVLFGLKCHDTQTGIKFYPGDTIRKNVERQVIDGYAFDIELLALANSEKSSIIEMPIELNYTRAESFGRIRFKDIWKMFTDTWKIWWKLRIKHTY